MHKKSAGFSACARQREIIINSQTGYSNVIKNILDWLHQKIFQVKKVQSWFSLKNYFEIG